MSSTPLTQAQILILKAAEDESVLQKDGLSGSILGFHARYGLLFQTIMPARIDLIETVRVIREHVVARIAALSGRP